MRNTKHVISALPLIADALGRKYGIKVIIGGERAYTNGKDIHLPSLPMDSDETVLNIARGYLDHEAAHLRTTDFEAVKAASFRPIEKHIWNLLEDYMVEQKLAVMYPGCGHNFNWLIRHLFLGQITEDSEADNSPVNTIFNWLLYCLRELSVPELADERDKLAELVDAQWPGLRMKLTPLVELVPLKCHDTKTCIDAAREIVAVIEDYIQSQKQQQTEQRQAQSQEAPTPAESNEREPSASNEDNGENKASEQDEGQNQPDDKPDGDNSANAQSQVRKQDSTGEMTGNAQDSTQEDGQASTPLQMLEDVLENPENLEPMDIGEKAGKELERMEDEDTQDKLAVAVPVSANFKPYTTDEIRQIRQETAALRTRLNGLLQAKDEARTHISRSGKVNLRRISRIACLDTRVFARRTTRHGINTAVHILLDASYSMEKEKIELASKATYALASALDIVRGVNVGVTAFPAPFSIENIVNHVDDATVAIIKRHGQRLHDRFHVECCGGTPLAEALWWLLQEMKPLKEQRKIVLILSDGFPDNIKMVKEAIIAHGAHGIEIYGIGIETPAMTRLLPESRSKAIYNLKELVPAVFDLLRPALIRPMETHYENAC